MLNVLLNIFGLILILLSIIGYGSVFYISKSANDLFFLIIKGYFVVGIIVLLLHFFLPINDFVSLIIYIVGIVLLVISKFTIFSKNFIFSIICLILISLLITGYSDHPIDANMYHHPYVSYLKSEKIIFAVANIEFRFGHISLLQFTQSAFLNRYLNPSSILSINIIFFTFFLLFCFEILFKKKENKFIFLLVLFLSTFVFIKMGRYREHGNDLIPFLVGAYFLIKILREKITFNKNLNETMLLYFPLYSSFMLSHKVTYVFSGLIFFILLDKKKLKLFLTNRYLIIFFLLFTFLWILKNYIETSCLVYPIVQTCFKNSGWYLTGLADPSNAIWLSEIWAKGFIDNPNWQQLDLDIYSKQFNWLPTWLSNHFIKILEKISPLVFIMLITSLYLYFNKTKINFHKKKKLQNQIFFSQFIFLLPLIGIGLLIWFINSPLFRYGSFYIVGFIIIIYFIINYKIIDHSDYSKLINLKIIFIISIVFFASKNIDRQINSDNSFTPMTERSIENYEIFLKNPRILRPKTDVCFYTYFICSHEIPKNMKVLKKNSYLLFN